MRSALTLALGLLAYVIPGEIAIEQLVEQGAVSGPLRVEAALSGIGADWPERVVFQISAGREIRIRGGDGDGWVQRRDSIVSGPQPAPAWIPELHVLTLQTSEEFLEYLQLNAIDVARNELARCGEFDCFVVGGRQGAGQLWLHKDEFFILRLRLPTGRTVEFSRHIRWGDPEQGPRFPEQIRIFDAQGPIATLQVETLAPGTERGSNR